MRVLGIDPGIGKTGWGIVDVVKGKPISVAHGCVETKINGEITGRLLTLFDEIEAIISEHKPTVVSVEQLFFNTNVTTAFVVGQARGIALLAAGKNKLPVFSYTPLQVKMALTGYGRAEKKQVGQMVKMLLKLPSVPKPDDTADALAIALTHAFSAKLNQQTT